MYKAFYVHISKSGGSSVAKCPWIVKHGSPHISPQVAQRSLDVFLSFAFVRDPLTRFSSAVLGHGYAIPRTFEKFVTTTFLDEHEKRFADWGTNYLSWAELQPQHRYIYFNDKVSVDYLGRFEQLNSGWREICTQVGEVFELPHENKNKYPDHVKCYTKKTREIVKQVYKEDFDLFGY